MSQVDLDVRDSHGRTPLFTAVESGNIDTTRILPQLGANASSRDMFGTTAFCQAVESGLLGLVELLLEFGANANG